MKIVANKWMVIGTVAVVAAVVAGVMFFTRDGGGGATEYFTAAADRGAIRNTVSATGVVQTVVTVQVGSQVSGQVEALYADFNSIVKRGQLLAKLDARNFEAQVQNANASVVAARARLRSAEAEVQTHAADVQSARASLDAALVTRDNTLANLKRAEELRRRGLTSANDFDKTQADADTAQARHDQAVAALAQVEARSAAISAQIEQVKAQLQQAQADLARATLNLEYTNIYSPVDGVVISRNVDVGQTIAASMQAPTLFSIANDLKRMQVNASVDEADIGSIPAARDVRFTVDAYPDESFEAAISEIRLSPTTVQNVVTYSVILSIDNAAMKLRPGMTANISLIVDERETALRIPNAALRYAPPGTTRPLPEPVRRASLEEGDDDGSAAELQRRPRAIADLAPGQRWDPLEKIEFDPPREASGRSAVVWVLNADRQPEQRKVLVGITDGSVSEVISGDVRPGELIIVGDNAAAPAGQAAAQGPGGDGPGFGGGRGGGF